MALLHCPGPGLPFTLYQSLAPTHLLQEAFLHVFRLDPGLFLLSGSRRRQFCTIGDMSCTDNWVDTGCGQKYLTMEYTGEDDCFPFCLFFLSNVPPGVKD